MMAIAAVDGHLYITGGRVSQRLDNVEEPYVAPINRTLSIPLDESWDIKDLTVMSSSPNSQFQQVSGHALVAGRSSGRDRLWSWGGRSSKQNAQLYTLTPNGTGGGDWTQESVPDSITRGEFGSGTSCDGKMVYFGGRARTITDNSVRNLDGDSAIALPGVLTYNFEDGTWNNKTSEGWPESQETYLRGELICGGMGKKNPVVFAIGGATIPPTDAKDAASQPLDMATITFWDMAGERWHQQKTVGGRVPPARESFCAVGAPGQNGTYEIFVYGGWDKDKNALDDIWILSLPGFRWFQTDAKSTPRFEHKCHRSGDQMVNVGGNVLPLWQEVDELSQGIGVFNLSSLEWQTNYVTGTEYDSPDLVKEYYANGGMDDVEWENDEVKAFFVESGDDDKNNGGGGDGDDSGSDTPVGAIAGGVVGGVAAIAIIGFLIWFMRRRHRNQRMAGPNDLSGTDMNKDSAQPLHQGQYDLPPGYRAELDPTSAVMEMEAGASQPRRAPVELQG